MQTTAYGKAMPCHQISRIMRLTALLLIVGLTTVAARTTGQVTLKERSTPLAKVLKNIQKQQKDYDLTFDQLLLQAKAKPVTVEVNNLPLEAALEKVFEGQDQLTYVINGKIISVKEKKAIPPAHISMEQQSVAPPPPPPTVHGRITNEKGEPVAGVNITIKGGKVVGITDNNGEFTLTNVADNAVLVFSAVTVETLEVRLNGRSELAFTLKTKVSELDEIQIVAYGQTSKRLNTGNTFTLTSKDIEKQPINNPILALQGRVAGVTITPANGIAGGGINVQIRGQNFLTLGTNDPLYIVDGVPYTSQLLPGLSANNILGSDRAGTNQFGSPLSFINPDDIETISVLKDADATSIYGTRAANGAVIITTKKGKIGETKTTINIQEGFGKVPRKIDLMNASQYLSMRREAFKNDNITPGYFDFDVNGTWDTTLVHDWQKELIGGTARYSNYNASVSGGNGNMQYLVGSTYHRETTVFSNQFSDQKGSVHFNLSSSSLNKRFKIQLTGNYQYDNNSLPGVDLTNNIYISPIAPQLFNSDGSINWANNSDGVSTFSGNPIRPFLTPYSKKTNNIIGNLIIGYDILQSLNFSISTGFTKLNSQETGLYPLSSYADDYKPFAPREAQFNNQEIQSWLIEPTLRFSEKIFKGKFEAIAGATINQNSSIGTQLTAQGQNSDATLLNLGSATSIAGITTVNAKYKYVAAFTRLNYNLYNRYIFNVAARRDGSSRFGSNNRFANFGSVGAAWIFTEEKFFKPAATWLSFGKLRASYGTTGSDQIGDYQYLNLYNIVGGNRIYQGITTLQPNGLANPYLQWQATNKFELATSLGFLQDKIILEVAYFDNRSSNQLGIYPLPQITGYASLTKNLPIKTQQKGLELSLATTNVKRKDFMWTSAFNITWNSNKLLAYYGLPSPFYIVGSPFAGSTLLYQAAGINPTTGQYQFVKADGSLTTSPNGVTDKTQTISTIPRYYGGLQNTFKWKRLTIDFLFQFSNKTARNNLYNLNLGIPGNMGVNQPTALLNRWQKPGDVATFQPYTTQFNTFGIDREGTSDAAYSTASYLRLKNASISWDLPLAMVSKIRAQSIRIYAQGQNLFTITKFQGLDPETGSVNSLPLLRVITFGIHAEL